MMPWRHITLGFRSLLRGEQEDRDVADEVTHFLDEATARLIADGVSPEEARRLVHLRYGDGLPARAEVRSYGWESTIGALLADLRYAGRRLRRRPGFTAVAVLTLGLGIGASSAIFSVVSPVLLERLPYPDAQQILSISDRSEDGSPIPITFGSYVEASRRSRAFEALAVFRPWQPVMTGEATPERLAAQRVSGDYFAILGVPPALGRGLDADADRPGGANIVVLSDGLWRRRFGADPEVLGRAVRLDDAPYVVVGVMPRGFENVTAPLAEAWSTLQYDASLPTRDGREWGHHLEMIGRLQEGTSPDAARQELEAIARAPVAEFARPPWASMEEGLSLRPLRDVVTSGARPMTLALTGAALLLLVIACVNVTILLLARGAQREGELALRAALGAGRGRLARQLLTESLLLAGLGGAVGLGLAQIGVSVLVALSPPGLPRVETIGMDLASLGFALGLTTAIGLLVGLAPALARPRLDLHGATRGTRRGRLARTQSAGRALVATEVALAAVLLVGAGLLLRSIQRLFAVPLGFDPASVTVMQLHTSGFDDDGATERFFERALDAVREIPGVGSAALTSQLPLSGDQDIYGVTLEGREGQEAPAGPAYRHAVSPGFFETMGVRLTRGRALRDEDAAGATPAAVVSEAFAARVFPGLDPIGRRIHIGRTDLPPYTIVGVADDLKHLSLDAEQADAVYVTPEQWYFADPVRWLVARAERGGLALAPAIRRAVWSVHSGQPIVRSQSMSELVARSEALRRFVMIALEGFAALALVLAGVGLYGVLSGSVNDRLPEIGLRAALGASQTRILTLVIRQGMVPAAIGVALGFVGAAAASRALRTLLFGVSRLDAATYLGVAAVLAAVSALACSIPAARAARADPLRTLRAE